MKSKLSIFVIILTAIATIIILTVKFQKTLYTEKLVQHLKIFTVYDKNGEITLIRNGKDNDGGYIVPEIALIKADVLLGYGIADDISFEEQFSNRYQKPSYGFDCGVENISIKNKLCTFIPKCIGSDKHLYYNQRSSHQISSFSQQIDELKLKNKKIFLKMDIEGAEYDVFHDILNHSDELTGIAMELHLNLSAAQLKKALKLLDDLDQRFFLVHVHGNNHSTTFTTKNSQGGIPKALELTYINKNLVDKAEIALDQSHPKKIDMPCVSDKKDSEFTIL